MDHKLHFQKEDADIPVSDGGQASLTGLSLDWIRDRPFPRKEVGLYLVWLTDPARGNMRTACVFKVSNGTMCCIGDHFFNDVINDDCRIAAWCVQPGGPAEHPKDPACTK